jgi:hypothetical protein
MPECPHCKDTEERCVTYVRMARLDGEYAVKTALGRLSRDLRPLLMGYGDKPIPSAPTTLFAAQVEVRCLYHIILDVVQRLKDNGVTLD